MANLYDFKELERELERIKNRLEHFKGTVHFGVAPVRELNRSRSQYSKNDIEREIERKIEHTQREIDRMYSRFINDIRHYQYQSLEKIKAEARYIK